MRGEHGLLCRVQTLKSLDERSFRCLSPGEAHCPKQIEKVRLGPGVLLYVSCNVHTAMQDVHVLPEHLNDGLLLRVMPVTYERLDVFVILGNKRQEPGKRIRGSFLMTPQATQWTVSESSRHKTETSGKANSLVHEVSSMKTCVTTSFFAIKA